MKILVLGGGVIGVATAYYLQRAGHQVSLIERNVEVARETSFANGGQISWSAGHPWAEPGIPLTALSWLFKAHSPLVLRPRFDPALWSWLMRMLRNCTAERYTRNKEILLRLARYSYQSLTALRDETKLKYDATTRGTLVLYRNAAELQHALRERPLWDRLGIDYRVLDANGCYEIEPGLSAARTALHSGLHFPADEAGDCRTFTLNLMRLAHANGVRFSFNTTVERLLFENARVTGVVANGETLHADAVVLACGSYTPQLLRPLGIHLPVYPVKGYSLTLPIIHPDAAPLGTITDERYKVVITRLGDRLRAAGTAELAGFDLTLRPARCKTIAHVVREVFPLAGDFARAEYWTGLRPMTPDNPPVLGVTPFENLFLNTGHGTLGWTMACGSAKVLADVVSGRQPDIELDGLTLQRFLK